MPRKIFDRELANLNQRMAEMGSEVDSRVQRTIYALRTMDLSVADEVAKGDNDIDRMVRNTEKDCIDLITLQQPIAKDLRTIAAFLKILTDVEREADQCADICEILSTGELKGNSLAVTHVVRMLESARAMFRGAMNVLISRDVEEARKICDSDDEVDAMFSKIILEVCNYISENPASVMSEIDLLFITKYVERLGDHATNIAEWVIYMETGQHPDLNTQ